jgi:hypothetical protein
LIGKQEDRTIWGSAISLAVSASGAVKTKTIVLLTPEQASKNTIEFRPPGA